MTGRVQIGRDRSKFGRSLSTWSRRFQAILRVETVNQRHQVKWIGRQRTSFPAFNDAGDRFIENSFAGVDISSLKPRCDSVRFHVDVNCNFLTCFVWLSALIIVWQRRLSSNHAHALIMSRRNVTTRRRLRPRPNVASSWANRLISNRLISVRYMPSSPVNWPIESRLIHSVHFIKIGGVAWRGWEGWSLIKINSNPSPPSPSPPHPQTALIWNYGCFIQSRCFVNLVLFDV